MTMHRHACTTGLLALAALAGSIARADDVRYYEKDGVTYCETRHAVQRPISETHLEDRTQTVYVPQAKTQTQAMQRVVQVPVTEYVLESYWVNRFNPFVEPTQAYRYVPRTRWESRVETVQVPVVQNEMVAQQQTLKIPVTTQRMASEEQVTTVAVSARPVTQGTTAVAQAPLGPGPGATAGGAHLDGDPPRGATAWRPADNTTTIH